MPATAPFFPFPRELPSQKTFLTVTCCLAREDVADLRRFTSTSFEDDVDGRGGASSSRARLLLPFEVEVEAVLAPAPVDLRAADLPPSTKA
jgi:hypothetical protein